MTPAAREVLRQYYPTVLAVIEAAEELARCSAEHEAAWKRSAPPKHVQHWEFSEGEAADKVVVAVQRMQALTNAAAQER